jgi:hypothetical protein
MDCSCSIANGIAAPTRDASSNLCVVAKAQHAPPLKFDAIVDEPVDNFVAAR